MGQPNFKEYDEKFTTWLQEIRAITIDCHESV